MNMSFLSTLRCPRCASLDKGALAPEPAEGSPLALVCRDCGERYPVREGIPVLLTRDCDFLHILDREGLIND